MFLKAPHANKLCSDAVEYSARDVQNRSNSKVPTCLPQLVAATQIIRCLGSPISGKSSLRLIIDISPQKDPSLHFTPSVIYIAVPVDQYSTSAYVIRFSSLLAVELLMLDPRCTPIALHVRECDRMDSMSDKRRWV